jgi:hypothetical protein
MAQRRVAASIGTTQKGGQVANLPLLITVGIIAAVALIGGTTLLIRGAIPAVQPTALPVSTVAPSPTPQPTATPAPTATLAPSPYLAILAALSGKGDWTGCVTMAEGALSTLSESDRTAITRYAVACGMKELAAEIFDPLDRAGHQRMVDRYLTLRQRANDAGVMIDTPLVVARSAYASSQFALARVALEEAFKDGSWKPTTDRDITKMYISTLFGLGKWYTSDSSKRALYQEGLGYLSASDALQLKYQTGQGDAAQLLAILGYTDRAKYPKGAATPLLPDT